VEELPCSCPVCSKRTAKELKEIPKQERIRLIAEHNLYVLLEELRRIREAIREGRLWELLESRAGAHPSMMEALREYVRYSRFIATKHPVTRFPVRGIFFTSRLSRYRPEVVRHHERLRYRVEKTRDTLLLFEETPQKPFTRAGLVKELMLQDPEVFQMSDAAVLSYPFSVIPLELDGVYPLSQYEASRNVFDTAMDEIAADVLWYILGKGYKGVVLVHYTLPERFVRKLSESLASEEVFFLGIRVENYQEALSNPKPLAARIRAALLTLLDITHGKRAAPAPA